MCRFIVHCRRCHSFVYRESRVEFCLEVFCAFVNSTMHFAAIFTQLEWKWELFDVKNFDSNDVYIKLNF